MQSDSQQRTRGRRAAVALLGGLLAAFAMAPPAVAGIELEPRRIAIENKNLFDLGIADYDRDGFSDVFTTNHSQASSLLRNRGNGRFSDQIIASGLDHDEEFPGLADITRAPDRSRPGLYIYGRSRGRYEVRRVGEFAGDQPLAGSLRFRTGVSVADKENAAVALRRNAGAEPPITRVDFELPADGSRVLLDPPFLDVPVRVQISQPLPLTQVFIGSRAVTPTTRSFELRLPDRHGIAIADLNGDGLRDAWVISGGNKGQIGKYEGLIQDELLINSGTIFEERRESLGVSKGLCRGRTAETVDYDGDGLLDLFSSCADDEPKLYRQLVDGTFADVSASLGDGNPSQGTEYRWSDLHGNRRPELLIARGTTFTVLVYRRRSDDFERLYRIRRASGGSVRGLVVADYENDGDQDVFASSPAGNALLVNRGGRLRSLPPETLGLPERSATAAWVDHNNDGRSDLHTVPDGFFRQQSSGSFRGNGVGAVPEAGGVFAPTVWFDLENDGDRDLLLAYKREGRLERAVRLFETRGGDNHWLHVDLTASGRNTDAIGAEVRLRAAGKHLTQWVGQSDSSRHSRGDHRLYFGLGGRSRIKRLTVIWPDGTRTVRRGVRADRVLSISQ